LSFRANTPAVARTAWAANRCCSAGASRGPVHLASFASSWFSAEALTSMCSGRGQARPNRASQGETGG